MNLCLVCVAKTPLAGDLFCLCFMHGLAWPGIGISVNDRFSLIPASRLDSLWLIVKFTYFFSCYAMYLAKRTRESEREWGRGRGEHCLTLEVAAVDYH